MTFIFMLCLYIILTDGAQTLAKVSTFAPPLPRATSAPVAPPTPPPPSLPAASSKPLSTLAPPVPQTNIKTSAAPQLPVTNTTNLVPPFPAPNKTSPGTSSVTVPSTAGTSSTTARISTTQQITTSGIADGTLRLVNGTFPSEGRLEVYHNGQWGTVCDDYFDAEEAAVACKQLGFYKPPYAARGKAVYGAGTGQIWLDNVVCNGSETSLTQCNHTAFGGGNCGHYEDVGLICDLRNRIRLVNGWKYTEGRVEVYHNGEWGTVCGRYNFYADEATAICKTLGFVSGKAAPVPYSSATKYGQGSGRVWLYDVDCTGNEGSFFDCQHVTWSAGSCGHYYDVGVDCTPGSLGNASEVRLFDGWKKSEGRVEVYHNGKRGTVCDDSFGVTEAAVVCKTLGYSGKNAVPKTGAYFGRGTGQVVLDDVDCRGYETSIFMCQHTTFGTSNCNHNEDVGVDCDPGSREGRLNKTDMRLVGGSRPSEGRLELFHSGEWGTICASGWDEREATVVCNMLGYNGAVAAARVNAYYGQGSGRKWFDQLICQGNETHLLDCFHRAGTGCNHYADVGVDCHPDLDGNATTIRLVNGNRTSAGRVEVLHNGQWGTVCDHYFGKREAKVICKMLGFSGSLYASRIGAFYGAGTGQIWLDNVNCVGNETNFFFCQHTFWGQNSCDHSRDAGVDCDVGLEGNSSTVRLVGGWKKSEGRIEVLHDGQWGTVCDYSFGYTEARVLCRMLGFNGTNPTYRTRAYYGQGTGPEWLYNVDCTGSETNFFECSHYGWGTRSCGHYHDVGVDCDPRQIAQIVNASDFRLVNGTSPTQGRLELYHEGEWGSVCLIGWDLREAEVVCRMLNLSVNSTKVKARAGAYFGESPGPVWIDNIRCNGNEATLQECYHSMWGRKSCDHQYDVGVDCAPASEGNSSTIRLVNGARPSQGRLEVFHNGEWGTVCDDHFDIVDAQAACRTMGYSGNWVQIHVSFGDGKGRIWLDEVDCRYGDTNIFVCDHEPWGRTDCAHGEDVGIDCKPELDGNRTTIRLVNGSKSANGRLEMYHDGHWGTVCNHGWDDTETKIACKSLGYTSDFVTHSLNQYGQGNGTIQLDDFSCRGNESSIFECQHGDWGHAACDHSEEVGIECDPDLNLRLVNGTDQYSGRVEVKVNGTWGTVCSYGFDSREANVICKMLGNRRGGSVASSGLFGFGKGPIKLSYLGCTGNEHSIFQCSNQYYRYCRHSYDVAVQCRKGCMYDSDCDNHATCLADNTCKCQRGWVGKYCDSYVGPNGDCRLPDACPRHSVCVPGNSSHVLCACVSGYEMKRLKCVDIDECQRGNVCPNLTTCQNTEGGYTCNCIRGYKHKGTRCEDEDECLDPKACPPFTVCENLPGSYECKCASGYKQDGLFCTDVDECQSSLCPAGTQCTNTPGSFKCTCKQGYALKGFLCQDINECNDAALCPQQHANCINTPGNYSCTCMSGFTMNKNGLSCDDINECSGRSVCPTHSHCANEVGDYKCVCDQGYMEKNFKCMQITG